MDKLVTREFDKRIDTGLILCKFPKVVSKYPTLVIENQTFHVLESHLSVYQYSSTKSDNMGAYHHTLYLSDTQDNQYVIHLYFNQQPHPMGLYA